MILQFLLSDSNGSSCGKDAADWSPRATYAGCNKGIPAYSLSYMLGCAGLYLAIRKVLQATEPLLADAATAHVKSPTRVS